MKRLRVRAFALASLFLIFGFAVVTVNPASAQSLGGDLFGGSETPEAAGEAIASEQTPESDARIRDRLLGIFNNLEGLSGVAVEVESGVVNLGGTVLNAAAADQAEDIAGRVEGVVAVNNGIAEERSVGTRLGGALDKLQGFASRTIDLLPLIAVALAVFLVLWLLGRFIAGLNQPWSRLSPNAFIRNLVRQVVVAVFAFAGLILALDILDATAFLGTILGAAGIIGLAVGFAVRDTIENYIASILLSLRQPFAPNDLVRIDGNEGHVITLTSRATTLLTPNGNHVRIPNAQVFKAVIVNFTRNPQRRFEFRVGVDVDDDLQQAQTIALGVLHAMDSVLDDPEPLARVEELGESNVVLWIAGWVDQRTRDFAKVRSEAIRLVKAAFEAAEITMPDPIYNVRVQQVDQVPPRAVKPVSPAAITERVDALEGDTRRDQDIEEKVEAERERAGDEDLLDPGAPRE